VLATLATGLPAPPPPPQPGAVASDANPTLHAKIFPASAKLLHPVRGPSVSTLVILVRAIAFEAAH